MLVLVVAASIAAASPDEIKVTPAPDALVLSWDGEDAVLRGAVRPPSPSVGEPVKVALRVGGTDGTPFKDEVRMVLRPVGEDTGPTEDVEPEAGLWEATFVPRVPGPHLLDVSFTTGRPVSLTATFDVVESRFPRAVVWTVGILIALVAVFFGVRRIVRTSPLQSR